MIVLQWVDIPYFDEKIEEVFIVYLVSEYLEKPWTVLLISIMKVLLPLIQPPCTTDWRGLCWASVLLASLLKARENFTQLEINNISSSSKLKKIDFHTDNKDALPL